jgi:hypothetical protein
MKKFTQIMFSVCTLIVSVAGSAFASPPPQPIPTPEPGTMALVGIGVAGFMLYKKIKK